MASDTVPAHILPPTNPRNAFDILSATDLSIGVPYLMLLAAMSDTHGWMPISDRYPEKDTVLYGGRVSSSHMSFPWASGMK